MDRGKDRRDTRTAGWTEVRIGLTTGLQGGQRCKDRRDTRTAGWAEV